MKIIKTTSFGGNLSLNKDSIPFYEELLPDINGVIRISPSIKIYDSSSSFFKIIKPINKLFYYRMINPKEDIKVKTKHLLYMFRASDIKWDPFYYKSFYIIASYDFKDFFNKSIKIIAPGKISARVQRNPNYSYTSTEQIKYLLHVPGISENTVSNTDTLYMTFPEIHFRVKDIFNSKKIHILESLNLIVACPTYNIFKNPVYNALYRNIEEVYAFERALVLKKELIKKVFLLEGLSAFDKGYNYTLTPVTPEEASSLPVYPPDDL